MKPHIYFSQGVWWCRLPAIGRRHAFYGIGSTPKEAAFELQCTLARGWRA